MQVFLTSLVTTILLNLTALSSVQLLKKLPESMKMKLSSSLVEVNIYNYTIIFPNNLNTAFYGQVSIKTI